MGKKIARRKRLAVDARAARFANTACRVAYAPRQSPTNCNAWQRSEPREINLPLAARGCSQAHTHTRYCRRSSQTSRSFLRVGSLCSPSVWLFRPLRVHTRPLRFACVLCPLRGCCARLRASCATPPTHRSDTCAPLSRLRGHSLPSGHLCLALLSLWASVGRPCFRRARLRVSVLRGGFRLSRATPPRHFVLLAAGAASGRVAPAAAPVFPLSRGQRLFLLRACFARLLSRVCRGCVCRFRCGCPRFSPLSPPPLRPRWGLRGARCPFGWASPPAARIALLATLWRLPPRAARAPGALIRARFTIRKL